MGIFKKANNIYITVRDTYTSISGSSYEEAEEVIIEATNGDLELISQKKVIMQGLGKEGDTTENSSIQSLKRITQERSLSVKTIDCLDELEVGYFADNSKGKTKGVIKGKEYVFKVTEYLEDIPNDEEKQNITWEFFYRDENGDIVLGSKKNKKGDTFILHTKEHDVENENIEIVAYFNHSKKEKEGYIRLPYYLYDKIPEIGRLYFVGGAANDSDGWNYIPRFKKIWNELGFKDFKRIDVSEGKIADVLFVEHFREAPFYYTNTIPPIKIEIKNQKMFKKALFDIKSDLKTNPLSIGRQLNLVGYSYGSVMVSQVTLVLISEGYIVDNLILIGSPIPDNSDLMKLLKIGLSTNKIRNIIREDIVGDYLSNPDDYFEFIKGGIQSAPFVGEGDDAPHFDLARPNKEADDKIRKLGIRLRKKGVK